MPAISLPTWASILLVVCGAALTNVQPVTCQTQYRLVFQDRVFDGQFVPGSTLYDATLSTFSPKAIERRTRSGLSPVLTELDRPFDTNVLGELESLGVTRGAELRWRNSLVVECDDVQAMLLRSKSWVKALEPVHSDMGTASLPDCLPARYGSDRNQLDIINIIPLHDAGVYGQGATIGMIDVGFRWFDHPSMLHVDVRGEWDVINNDSITSNQEGDLVDHDGHGTLVLSMAAAWAPDTLVGASPLAAYLLAKTEDLRHERRIEDVHFAAAVEFLERRGADVLSASIGYRYFDSTEVAWPWEAFNGRTSFSAQAVNQAAAFGMACVTAAGNSGPAGSTLMTPADADSAIAVGSITPEQTTAAFTSRGPTADGRNKPDVLAPGGSVVAATYGEGFYRRVGGTSMSAPLVAASLALLRSLYPQHTMWELRQALMQTVSPTRDSAPPMPWAGVANAMAAAQSLGPAIPNVATVYTPTGRSIMIPVIATPGTVVRAEGSWPFVHSMPLTCQQLDSMWWECDVPVVNGVRVRIEATYVNKTVHYPNEGWLPVPDITTIPCGMRLPSGLVSAAEPARRRTIQAKTVIARNHQHVRVQVSGVSEIATVVWIDAMGKRLPATVLQQNANHYTIALPPAAGLHVVEMMYSNGVFEHHTILIEP
jgi:serine protease AprX